MFNLQRDHYHRIHDEYAAHYYDDTSLAYRREFILKPLLSMENLSDKRVADLACGSGYNSLLLRAMFSNVTTEGYDISELACRDYERVVGAKAHECDLTQPLDSEAFDAAMIIGGLHHCANQLPEVLRNIANIIKPGGMLYAFEPNASFAFESVRKFWYRHSNYFEHESERALDVDRLIADARPSFRPLRTFYSGGPAYFLILNSLITRVPMSWKRYAARPIFAIERAWNTIPSVALMPAFGIAFERT